MKTEALSQSQDAVMCRIGVIAFIA